MQFLCYRAVNPYHLYKGCTGQYSMQDSKEMNWRNNFSSDAEADADAPDTEVEAQAADKGQSAEADGWQQYRRWISKAPAPNRRRTGVDPSLYTWKGYRDWSDQVKRNWSKESDGDE